MSADQPSLLEAIGFPPPLLGMDAMRLSVVGDDGELLAVNKPLGVLVTADPWHPRLPMLIEAIRYQAANGKGELVRAGVGKDGLWAVSDLDPMCFGPVLMTRHRSQAEALRNDLGSARMSFDFELLTRDATVESPHLCDLPITRHRQDPRMLVSHTTGKQSCTSFEKIEEFGRFSMWKASIALPRRDQVLIHAAESGLPVVGDNRYGRSQLPMLSNIKRGYQPKRGVTERPLYPGPVYRLASIKLADGREITGAIPPRWNALLTQLRRIQ